MIIFIFTVLLDVSWLLSVCIHYMCLLEVCVLILSNHSRFEQYESRVQLSMTQDDLSALKEGIMHMCVCTHERTHAARTTHARTHTNTHYILLLLTSSCLGHF